MNKNLNIFSKYLMEQTPDEKDLPSFEEAAEQTFKNLKEQFDKGEFPQDLKDELYKDIRTPIEDKLIKELVKEWNLNIINIFENLKDPDFDLNSETGLKPALFKILREELKEHKIEIDEKRLDEIEKTKKFGEIYDALYKENKSIKNFQKKRAEEIQVIEKGIYGEDPKVVFNFLSKSPEGKKFIQNVEENLKSYYPDLDKGLVAAENSIGGIPFNPEKKIPTPGKKGRNVKIIIARKATIIIVLMAAFFEALSSLFSKAELYKMKTKTRQEILRQLKGTEEMESIIEKKDINSFLENTYQQEFAPEYYFEGIISKIGEIRKLHQVMKTINTTHFAGLAGKKDSEGNIDPDSLEKNLAQIFTAGGGPLKDVLEIIKKTGIDLNFSEVLEKLEEGKAASGDVVAIRNGINKFMTAGGGPTKIARDLMLRALEALGVKQTAGAKLGEWTKEKFKTIKGEKVLAPQKGEEKEY